MPCGMVIQQSGYLRIRSPPLSPKHSLNGPKENPTKLWCLGGCLALGPLGQTMSWDANPYRRMGNGLRLEIFFVHCSFIPLLLACEASRKNKSHHSACKKDSTSQPPHRMFFWVCLKMPYTIYPPIASFHIFFLGIRQIKRLKTWG